MGWRWSHDEGDFDGGPVGSWYSPRHSITTLTTDVQLAAFAIEHRGEMRSNDTDFARFPDLNWVDPLK